MVTVEFLNEMFYMDIFRFWKYKVAVNPKRNELKHFKSLSLKLKIKIIIVTVDPQFETFHMGIYCILKASVQKNLV